ncbi:MAG: hypothetical protein NTV98_05995 [Candidatus Roizmanbacteria bacterium]|nr:hypothetical protein [Candidatus Roizmanbacteria bacterium]
MIDTDGLIQLIINGTSLTANQVVRAKETEDNLQNQAEIPMVYVGFATIDSIYPEKPLATSMFNVHGEDLTQSFDITMVCKETALVNLWTSVYSSLIGQNPSADERPRTGLTYVQGGKVAITNGKIWHMDRWRIGFPTLFCKF